jgi:hypothetical protein
LRESVILMNCAFPVLYCTVLLNGSLNEFGAA